MKDGLSNIGRTFRSMMKHIHELKQLNYIEMGRRIRSQRELSRLTREELAGYLAGYLDLSPKFIADLEYGEKGVSIRNLYLLTQALDVSADYLLAGGRGPSDDEGERQLLKEKLMASLDRCSLTQLQYLEQIVKYYIKAVLSDESN